MGITFYVFVAPQLQFKCKSEKTELANETQAKFFFLL